MTHNSPVATLFSTVIDAGLCTRCGTCVGVCPEGALQFADTAGACLPEIAHAPSCDDCDAPCLTACPGPGIDFAEANIDLFGELPPDLLLGNAKEMHIAWSANAQTRKAASSGGVITEILSELLDSGKIDGAVCLIDDPEAPLLPRPAIIEDPQDLAASQQSKYSLAPLTQVLRETAAYKGRLAIVALPHQVQSIRKLQKMGHASVRNIDLVLGSYCGIEQHFTAVTSFLAKHGVRDLSSIVRIEYRAGNWPGHLRVSLRDGRWFELEKFYANYLSLFHAVERSTLCVDLTNELADISFGDAWADRLEGLREGYSLVVCRTQKGCDIIDDMRRKGRIETEPSSREEAIAMHSHGLYNKKVAVWSRMDLRRFLGRNNPAYGYFVTRTMKQKLVGLWIALTFFLAGSRAGRTAIQFVPLNVIGPVFLYVRRRWRKATRTGRKGDLASIFEAKWTSSHLD